MPRRDQYGTHDDFAARPARSAPDRARDEHSVEEGFPVHHGRNFGGPAERAARTTRGGGAAFQGRDYERENYGGGYGHQHRPEAGRRAKKNWRGQVGGDGLDGLASERAFGTDADHQMAPLDPDQHYRRWRDAELAAHDEDYRAWRRRQAKRYDEDYARWKSARGHGKDRF
jgi:hypothetical protein